LICSHAWWAPADGNNRSRALLKSMQLLDSHPGHESLMVLPDFPRYRDPTPVPRTGRRAADIYVVLLDQTGTVATDRLAHNRRSHPVRPVIGPRRFQ
jgi:hypothetical protein